MTPEQFCYWLQGVFEIQMAGCDANEKRIPKLTEAQIEMIQRHLNSVFTATVMTQPINPTVTPYPGFIDTITGPSGRAVTGLTTTISSSPLGSLGGVIGSTGSIIC